MPDSKILVVYVIAGHGQILNGQQAAVVNEFNSNTSFYKLWAVEKDIVR